MPSTTFADFITQTNAERVYLVDITIGESLISSAWQTDATYTSTRKLSYGQENLILSNGKIDLVKNVSRVTKNGSDLTVQTSAADVDTTASSYYHDIPNQMLWVNVGGGIETLDSIVAYFTLYFGTINKQFTNNYLPYLISAPGIDQKSETVMRGIAEVQSGALLFETADTLFDKLYEKYTWVNNRVVVRFGGDALPFSEYQTLFTGVVTDKSWTRQAFNLSVKSKQFDLLSRIATSQLTITNWPNINENFVGTTDPIAWGTFTERTAPIAIPVDEAFATDQVKYRLAKHVISSIDGVWIDYGDGLGWIPADLGTAPLSANEYLVDSLSTATFIVEFTASGYVAGTTRVKAAFKGKSLASDTGPYIVENIITDELSDTFTSNDLDAAEFANAKATAVPLMAIYLNGSIRAIDVITKITNSDLAYFFINDDGQFVYRIWEPEKPSTIPIIDGDHSFKSISLATSIKELYSSIRVRYGLSYNNGTILSVAITSSTTSSDFERTAQKTIETFLTTSSDADILSQRVLQLNEQPVTNMAVKGSWDFASKEIGDKMKINMTKAPDVSGSFTEQTFEITGVTKDFNGGGIGLSLTNLYGIGDIAGYWMADDAPSFLLATDDERKNSGFYTDDDGLAVTGDLTTKGFSKWG